MCGYSANRFNHILSVSLGCACPGGYNHHFSFACGNGRGGLQHNSLSQWGDSSVFVERYRWFLASRIVAQRFYGRYFWDSNDFSDNHANNQGYGFLGSERFASILHHDLL